MTDFSVFYYPRLPTGGRKHIQSFHVQTSTPEQAVAEAKRVMLANPARAELAALGARDEIVKVQIGDAKPLWRGSEMVVY